MHRPEQAAPPAPDEHDGIESMARRVDEFQRRIAGVRAGIQRVVVGQEPVVDQVLWALLAGGHVLLEGVPGLGKTVLVRTLARVLGLGFARVQFTPDLMPADLLGANILEEQGDGRRTWRWEPGPIFAHLVLADEINRATPKTQSALLEAMAEHQVTAGGETRPLPEPFFVLATQNPVEMEGTYPLPEAQLDRFLFKVLVPYPSEDTLQHIARLTTGAPAPGPEAQAGGEAEVREWLQLVRLVPLADDLVSQAARLVAATHPDHPHAPEAVRRYVRHGASPRGLQALVLAAKARALCQGRLNVAYEDLAAVGRPALRHRLLLNFDAEAEGVGVDRILDDVLALVKEPGGV